MQGSEPVVQKWRWRKNVRKEVEGTSLVVQWLRLCAPNAGGMGSNPSQETKIPPATQLDPPKKAKQKPGSGCERAPLPASSGRPPAEVNLENRQKTEPIPPRWEWQQDVNDRPRVLYPCRVLHPKAQHRQWAAGPTEKGLTDCCSLRPLMLRSFLKTYPAARDGRVTQKMDRGEAARPGRGGPWIGVRLWGGGAGGCLCPPLVPRSVFVQLLWAPCQLSRQTQWRSSGSAGPQTPGLYLSGAMCPYGWHHLISQGLGFCNCKMGWMRTCVHRAACRFSQIICK